MTRPYYETAQHLSAEKTLKEIVEKKFNCTLDKMPIKYGLDFAARRSKRIVAFIELKRRKNKARDYATYMISMHKLMTAQQITETTGLQSLLIVQWADRIGYTVIDPKKYTYGVNGRTDRGDPDDMEPVAFIPTDYFTWIT